MNRYGRLALIFRKAIEDAKVNGEFYHDVTFRHFPSGCCDDASILLAEYLYEHGLNSNLVIGTYYGTNPGEAQNHAWLLVNDEIVDITVDQFKYDSNFPQLNIPLFIGKEHRLYNLFIDKKIHTDFRINSYENLGKNRLMNLYNSICKYI